MATEKETTTTIVEGVETGISVSDPSEEEKESSSESTDAEKKTEETTEPEKTEEPEESFEVAVDRVAKSIADKSTQTITNDRDSWRDRAEKAESQLNEKIYNLASNDMYGEEKEELGEEEATKRKSARGIRNKAVLEFQVKEASVNKKEVELGEKESSLQDVEKVQYVREKFWTLFFPDDKRDFTAYNEAVEKCVNSDDKKSVDAVYEIVRQGVKSKTKKFEPDSSQQGPSTGKDLSKLSSRELLILGEQKKKNK